ncbi:MAG: amidohydrolase family protein [Myxococcaceae bacterium]|nr:amidohydrolase family protein [Myxococcaceae bacterium]
MRAAQPLTCALLVLLAVGCTCRDTRPTERRDAGTPGRPRRVDVHVHVEPGAVPRLLSVMDARGIDVAVNLSGGWPGMGLEQTVADARRSNGRVLVFANPPLGALRLPDADVRALADQLLEAKAMGARGVKLFKSLGLSATWPDGTLVAVDDPRLDPLFEKAGALGLPVAIHTGDPKAFWDAVSPSNERFDELSVHPGWSYAGRPVPSWQQLYDAFLRRVARHPKTVFIGVHFGNAPEDPTAVAAALEANPNLYVDTAARVPELGRHPAEPMRALFMKHQDRILFGTDLGVGLDEGALMLGSTGATPPAPADVERFFTSTWRYFETSDKDFEHPTPIQGRWRISGLGLPRDVLDRVYAGNADRLLAPR